LDFFENYDEIILDIKEHLFEDGGEDGSNHSGNYTITIKPVKDIPHNPWQTYQGIKKLWTKCLG
jgi:hypothetical protein